MVLTDKVQEIKARIRARILDGTYPDGERMPTERELVTEFRTSRAMIRRALQELETEGLVEKRGTAGTRARAPREVSPSDVTHYVETSPWQATRDISLLAFLRERRSPDTIVFAEPPSLVAVPLPVAERMGLTPPALVLRRWRLVSMPDGVRRILESYYPADEQIINRIRHGAAEPDIGRVVADQQRQAQARAVTVTLAARLPSSIEEHHLRVGRFSPVADVVRTVRDPAGNVWEATRSIESLKGLALRYEYSLDDDMVDADESNQA